MGGNHTSLLLEPEQIVHITDAAVVSAATELACCCHCK